MEDSRICMKESHNILSCMHNMPQIYGIVIFFYNINIIKTANAFFIKKTATFVISINPNISNIMAHAFLITEFTVYTLTEL